MNDSLIGLVALNLTEAVTYDAYRALVERYGSVRKALAAPASELTDVPGVGNKTAKRLRELSNGDEAINEIEQAHDIDVEIITCEDERYPNNLNFIDDRPIVLYVRGATPISSLRFIRTPPAPFTASRLRHTQSTPLPQAEQAAGGRPALSMRPVPARNQRPLHYVCRDRWSHDGPGQGVREPPKWPIGNGSGVSADLSVRRVVHGPVFGPYGVNETSQGQPSSHPI